MRSPALRLITAGGLLLVAALGVFGSAPARSATAAAASDAATPPLAQPPASITVMNRSVAELSGTTFGIAPKSRALDAQQRIQRALASGHGLAVGTVDRAEGTLVQIDGATMFALTPDDTAERTLAAARDAAQQAAAVLKQAIEESRESRDMKSLLRAGLVTALATAVLGALLWVMRWVRRKVEGWMIGTTVAHADRLRVGGVEVVRREGLVRFERWLASAVYWLVAALLIYEWLSVALGQFPYTRAWGEQLNDFLFGLITRFVLAIVHAVPDLLAAALIFWLAWLLTRVLRSFFSKVGLGQVKVSWLGADVALTTSRLCVAVVWLFALVMAYPYLPGSDTEAFKGLSVLVGLMLSLGASNLVGQLASGLILTYTRAFQDGEYVRIDQHEGTVLKLGSFTTRLRTGMGEELMISNSQVLGAVTRNYSRVVKGKGFIIDTTVTIGYDTPWRQVTALLTEAARRTPGVLADPPPHVFQTALSDFYPEYRLVCQAVPSEPRPRAEVMSQLHANIQDLFNEHGVQIMSPHYLGDPENAKVVPREQWYAAPARPPRRPAGSADAD